MEPFSTLFWIGVGFLGFGLFVYAIPRRCSDPTGTMSIGFIGVMTGLLMMLVAVITLIASVVFVDQFGTPIP